MPGMQLNYYNYKVLTEKYLIEWIQNCLSKSPDNLLIPEHILEGIDSLSSSLAGFICTQKHKEQNGSADLAKSPYII